MIRKINLSSCERNIYFLPICVICEFLNYLLSKCSCNDVCDTVTRFLSNEGIFNYYLNFNPFLTQKVKISKGEKIKYVQKVFSSSFTLPSVYINALRTLKRVRSIYAHNLKTYSGIEILLLKKARERKCCNTNTITMRNRFVCVCEVNSHRSLTTSG
jgi:hypothetical protein